MNSSALKTLMLALVGGWGCTLATQAQTFTNGNSALPSTYNSGGCVGFADLGLSRLTDNNHVDSA